MTDTETPVEEPVVEPEPDPTPEPEPEPDADPVEGDEDVCDVCGRKGRAPGHH